MADVSNSFSAWKTLPKEELSLCIAIRRSESPPHLYEALIKYYEKIGIAEVIRFREYNDRPGQEWQLVGTQDCLQRSRHHSRYAIFQDLDERIVPAGDVKLRNLIKETMEISGKIAMISFVGERVERTSRLPLEYKGSNTLKYHLPTFVFYQTNIMRRSPKCAIDPRRVLLMWVHHVEVYFPGYTGYELPPEKAILRHYRDLTRANLTRRLRPITHWFMYTKIGYPAKLMPLLYRQVETTLNQIFLDGYNSDFSGTYPSRSDIPAAFGLFWLREHFSQKNRVNKGFSLSLDGKGKERKQLMMFRELEEWCGIANYSKGFPKIIAPFNYINVTEEEIYQGYFSYVCLLKAKYLHLDDITGFFVMSDDATFNFWHTLNLRNVMHPTGITYQDYTGMWWPSPYGKPAVELAVMLIIDKYRNDLSVQKMWKKYQEGLLANGFIRSAHRQLTEVDGWCMSDLYYVPATELHYFSELMIIFFEARLFHEIAISKFLYTVKHYRLDPSEYKYLWEQEREKWAELYSEDLVLLHPIKFSLFVDLDQRSQFCNTVVRTFKKALFDGIGILKTLH
ncbi:hypothetical protein RB195_011395 [Necator americanus]|uniref:Glycosyltransferase family 92 protein n=1 Tax=Necator americanus TaxID=51031 RepID=A0ABR1D282_NECAM